MSRILKLTAVLILLCSLGSCATLGRTAQAIGRTAGSMGNM